MELEKLKKLAELALEAAAEAGKKILEVYKRTITVDMKSDGSPLTEADSASHIIISGILRREKYPVMSEEGKEIPYDERKLWKNYWLVDPLDGTKEFIKRNGEFTVNIAFMENNSPVLGIIFQPANGISIAGIENDGVYKFSGSERLVISEKNKLHPDNNVIRKNFRVIASRTHNSPETDTFINRLNESHKNIELLNAGSALKFCLLAEGFADIYPRFAPTMEWDTAAGHAILKSTGKNIYVYPAGKEMTYNKPKLINDWFIAK